MANTFDEILGSAAGIAKGMGVTFKEMMSPTVTENYPDGPAKLEERYRGVHVLQRDENGMEKCVACFLCAAACPSNCIYIEAAENTDKVRISGGERYAKVYNIDYNRCIFCGYCVEACPTDAITHGHGFEVASFNTATLVMRKEQMLASQLEVNKWYRSVDGAENLDANASKHQGERGSIGQHGRLQHALEPLKLLLRHAPAPAR
jgi:NADH-quinone oxidoreductase subunit I